MNNILLIALLSLALGLAIGTVLRRAKQGSACCGEKQPSVKKRAAGDRDKSHYSHEAAMKIGGMTCENCARKVENALNGIEGTWATVRIEGNKAKVLTKEKPDEAELRRAVREAGYVVTEYTVLR